MDFEAIIYEKSNDGVATMTLNRPERLNALNAVMLREMSEVYADVRDDQAVKVLIITGAGRGFCSGADVKGWAESEGLTGSFSEGDARRAANRGKGSGVDIYDIEKPVIAAINGVAVGYGFNLTMACDLRIAAAGVKMGLIFVKRGLSPDMSGLWELPRIVGVAKAKELMFFGDLTEVEELERIGYLNKVVPPEELMKTTMDWAGRLAVLPAKALAFTKVGIMRGLEESQAALDHYQRLADTILYASEDHQEAVRALAEKREPRFTGS